jgi:mannosyl-oligosaccharide glucosidase
MTDGPYHAQARVIYSELRQNLIDNIYREFGRGFLWEQYSPENGKGQRSHPFTGWTALVVNIMAEKF